MAIKHGKMSISAVKHGSVTVSWVDHGSINVFASYAVTISAGTGINSVFLSTNPTALSGSPSGTKFIKGEIVHAFALLNTANADYDAPSSWTYLGNGNVYRVGNVTVNGAYNFGTINAEHKYYAVSIKAGTGVNSVFLSTNQNALSGSSSGTKFKKGTTVYAFAALDTAGYSAPSNWSYIGNGNIYRVGSATVNSAYNFGTINAETVSGPCTVECSSDLIGLQRVYLSTSSSATSGSSKLNVTPGNTVYGFAVLGSDVATSEIGSSWTLISGTACKQGAIYRVGSKTPTSAGYTTIFTIELFSSNTASSTVLFKRSGEGVGSWTVNHNIIQISSANDSITFNKSGYSVSCEYTDTYDRPDTITLGSFTCPSGYTINLTLVDKTGKSITWNRGTNANGPYVLNAETTAESSQT